MGAQWRGPNFKVLRAHGRAGSAASRAPVAGSFSGLCLRDLPSRWMAGLAAVDSGGIRSEENAGRGGDFPAEEIRGEVAGQGLGFCTAAQGRVFIVDRPELYGSGRVRQYLILTQAEPGLQRVLEQWQIRTALLPTDSTLANLLRELPRDWRAGC